MAEVEKELFARVLFESDRTCCVCRLSGKKVQIHHMDGDHSNNDRANLAVLCLDCHADAHATIPFARGLNADVVRLYAESWQKIVKLRVSSKDDRERAELREEVLVELARCCRAWRDNYIAKRKESGRPISDTEWSSVISNAQHTYSKEEWDQFRPLFFEITSTLMRRLEELQAHYADVLPLSLRTLVLRTVRVLDDQQHAYRVIPLVAKLVGDSPRLLIGPRFATVLQALCCLDEELSRLRQ